MRGIFAAQLIKPQARVLAEDRGIQCVTLDYDSHADWTPTNADSSRLMATAAES